jgi:two-component system cell cycle sensor histidine kinase/response regulator CckA
MDQATVLNVVIVGGGQGCKAIMDMIFAENLTQLRMKLIGVACTNPKAVGYRYAQEKGVYTTKDYSDLYRLKDLNMIIELTGRDDVANEISRTKPEHVRLIDHVAAHVFWDLFQIEEERIAERKRAEEKLRDTIKQLEVAYDQSIIYAQELKQEIEEHKRAREERKKLEAQLLHAQKMESIGTLAGGIAHDFNNLLMGIQGYASLILNDFDENHPHYHWVRRIQDHVESGAGLTRQLLGFAIGGKYDVRPTDMNEIIKNTSSMFGRTRKEVTIKEKHEQNLWTVEVDQGQIEQVLLNLYVNAWQAMPAGGHLYLETSNVTLDESSTKPYDAQPGRYVKISVTDTGTGMDEATQERIFDPFFTTKQMGWGTGLGLASAHEIIKSHGGNINVYSEKGEGTTFNIYLPATSAECKPQIAESQMQTEFSRGTETILLVDDEDMIIDVGEKMLTAMGYKVLTARGGKEAIEILSKAQRAEGKEQDGKESAGGGPGAQRPAPDLVILDMIMPGMGGGEVYDRMKEINPDIKVLLSSGYRIDGEVAKILDRGCDGFIQKPFNMKQLSQSIRKIMDEK